MFHDNRPSTQTKPDRRWSSLINRYWTVVLFCGLHAFIFFVCFNNGWIFGNNLQDDFVLSYYYSTKMVLGQLPYRDFAVEYPPLSLLFMLIPRLFSSHPWIYSQLFIAEMLVFDFAGLFLAAEIARFLGKSVWKTLAVYSIVLLAIGPIIIVRFDIIPAILLLAALYLFLRGNYTTSWVVIALGAMTKMFPVVVTPLMLVYHLEHRQYRQIIRGTGGFVIACAIIAVPFLIIGPYGFINSFTYQAGRNLQIETTYSSFLLLGKALGLVSASTMLGSGSVNLVSPLADALAKWSTFITMAFLSLILWSYHLKMSRASIEHSSSEAALLVNYFLLFVLVFVLTYKVFSPQFMIWFFPLVPLLNTRWKSLPWMVFALAALMTAFVYPKDYGGLEHGEFLAIGMLAARNISLIALAVLVQQGDTD